MAVSHNEANVSEDDLTAAARYVLDGVDDRTDPLFGDVVDALADWGMAVVPAGRLETLREALDGRS